MGMSEYIELSGHFYAKLTRREIEQAGGFYHDALDAAFGHTGIQFEEVADEWDRIELENEDE